MKLKIVTTKHARNCVIVTFKRFLTYPDQFTYMYLDSVEIIMAHSYSDNGEHTLLVDYYIATAIHVCIHGLISPWLLPCN